MVSSKSDWLIKSNPEDRSLCPYGRRGGWLGRFRLWRACFDTRLGSGSGLVGRALLRWWLSCHMICNLILSCGIVIMDCSLAPWLWIAGVR